MSLNKIHFHIFNDLSVCFFKICHVLCCRLGLFQFQSSILEFHVISKYVSIIRNTNVWDKWITYRCLIFVVFTLKGTGAHMFPISVYTLFCLWEFYLFNDKYWRQYNYFTIFMYRDLSMWVLMNSEETNVNFLMKTI